MTFIKGIVGAAAILIGLSAPSAHAGYVVDLTQQGSNVVATGSGALDLTGLTFLQPEDAPIFINPSAGIIITGPEPFKGDTYIGGAGPANFGSGADVVADSGSGDPVGIVGPSSVFFVPQGYVSDSPLSSSATWDNQTLSSLGARPGRYEWTWGSGANQNFTLVVGAAIPEPSTWAMILLGFAGIGFMGYQTAGRRRRTACNA